MDRPAAVGLALLLVAAGALALPSAGESPTAVGDEHRPSAGVAAGPADALAAGLPPTPTDNTTARMVIADNRLRRTAWDSRSPDLASAIAHGDDSLRAVQDRYALRERFARANTTDEREKVLDGALIDIEEATAALVDDQENLIAGYADGLVTKETLLVELARIDARAEDLAADANHVRALSTRIPAQWPAQRARELLLRLGTVQSPVRDRIQAAVAGNEPVTVHVSVSDTALVLAALDDGTYLREAHFTENREQEGTKELEGYGDAVVRAETYYGWAFLNRNSLGTDLAGDVFRTDVDHVQGRLLAYFDAHTGEVFHEVQSLDVDAMPTTTVTRASNIDLRATVNRTYPGGPMRIETTAADSGRPLDVLVTVDGRRLGRTGDDGVLWVVEPRRPYTVLLERGTSSLNVSVGEGDMPEY